MSDQQSQSGAANPALPGVDVSIKSIKPSKSADVVKGSVGPRSLERPTDAGAAPVAVLDQPEAFLVDGGGLVQPPDASWAIDWWIGADDRWYAPSREASVRQRRRGSGPVLDTSIRVPSGDVVHTTFATMAGGRQVQVIDVANQSPIPVALVLGLRPYDWTGVGALEPCRWISGHELEIGGWRLTMPREPNKKAFSTYADLWDLVEAGDDLVWSEPAASDESSESANGLVMFPLPHGTSIRVCLGPAGHAVKVESMPGPDNVAQGWNLVVDGGGRFDFPDPGVTELSAAARSRLLLIEPDFGERMGHLLAASTLSLRTRVAGFFGRVDDTEVRSDSGFENVEILAALAEAGYHQQTNEFLGDLIEPLNLATLANIDPARVSMVIVSVARAATLSAEAVDAEALLVPLARFTKQLESSVSVESPHWQRAARGLLLLAERLNQSEAGHDLRSRLSDADSDGVDHDGLTETAQRAHPSGRWLPEGGQPDSVVEAARFWREARRTVVNEVVGAERPTIELLPGFPASWRGGSVEIHDAATAYGPMSFAIRWHGARPALLWDQGEADNVLVCPALDPHWSSELAKGETLLAGSSDGLAEAPAPGDSFI